MTKPSSSPSTTTSRTCGECSACCVSIRVQSEPSDPVQVAKPPGVRCPQLDSCGKCSIYEQRPSPCATYRCSWLEGWGEEGERPDRCGIIGERSSTGDGSLVLFFPSIAPGFAEHNRSCRDVLKLWRERGAIVLDGPVEERARVLRELGVVMVFADGTKVDFR